MTTSIKELHGGDFAVSMTRDNGVTNTWTFSRPQLLKLACQIDRAATLQFLNSKGVAR